MFYGYGAILGSCIAPDSYRYAPQYSDDEEYWALLREYEEIHGKFHPEQDSSAIRKTVLEWHKNGKMKVVGGKTTETPQ